MNDSDHFSLDRKNSHGFQPLFENEAYMQTEPKRKLSDLNRQSLNKIVSDLQLGEIPTVNVGQRIQTLEDAAKACLEGNNLNNASDPNETTDHLYDSDGSKNQQYQVNWDAFKQQIDASGPTEQTERNEEYSYLSSHFDYHEFNQKPQAFKSVLSDSGHQPVRNQLLSLSQAGSQPNLLFQPFQQQKEQQTMRTKSIQSSNSPLHSDHQRFFANKMEGHRNSITSMQSLQSMQTQRQAISHRIQVSDDPRRFDHFTSGSFDEEQKEGQQKLDGESAGGVESNKQNVTFEQLKEYDRLVIQLIKDQINQENKQRQAFYQQLQKQPQLQSFESKTTQPQPKRNPFQATKIPKIFSKPRFPVTKSFTAKSKSSISPQTKNICQIRPQQQQVSKVVDPVKQNGKPQVSQFQQFQRKTDIDQDFEEEEMIEEIIEIEESDENLSKEKRSNDDYNSGTYGTNIAGGGRGSMGSMIDSNYYGIQAIQFGQNLLDEESFSQQHDLRKNDCQVADNQLFVGESLKCLQMQSHHSEAASTFEVFNAQPQHRSGSQFVFCEAGSIGIDNIQFQHPEPDLDIIFGQYQIENLTENEEAEEPFYIPRGLASNEKKQQNVQKRQFTLIQKADSTHNQSLVAMFNSSLIFEDDRQQSIEIIGSDELAIIPAQNPILQVEEEKKEAPFAYDDDIVNQNSSLSFSQRSDQSLANNLHHSGGQCNMCSCKKRIRSSKISQQEQSFLNKSSQNNGPARFTYFSAKSLSDDRWVCPICLDIFVDAVETPCCNNLFCERCIMQTQNCPLCSSRIIGALKPNIPIRRLVLELSITCPNELCDQIIRRCDIDKHNAVCQFLPIECPNNPFCGQIIRRDLAHHCEYLCAYRTVSCLLNCGQRMALNLMDQHIRDECANTELQCKNRCSETILRGNMDHHINFSCVNQPIACPNKGESLFEEGCSSILKRKDLEQHKTNCMFRRVVCQNPRCSSVLIYKDINMHDERCLFKIVECDNKCGQKTLRQHIQQHKEVCEFQLVKCPYYDLGCKIEVLRKDRDQHLMEEGFNHSVIFIEGQKRKNKEIDELKTEIRSLRQDYNSEVQWMYNEVNQLKIQMRQMLRGSQDEQSNQTFDIYANRSLPQSVQLRLNPHNTDQIQTNIIQQRHQHEIQNHKGSRYLPGSERMSVASISNLNQPADSQNLVQNEANINGNGLSERPVTRRGRQTNSRIADFSQQEQTLRVVRVFNNQPQRNFDSVLDGNSLDQIVINDNTEAIPERPQVAYNNFFQRTFTHVNHRHQPRLEESPIVQSNEQELGLRIVDAGSLSQELNCDNVISKATSDIRAISQMNPLTAISNPNFSRKNTNILQKSNDDDDALGFLLGHRRSLESEVNLHNISTEHADLQQQSTRGIRQSEEMKYPQEIFNKRNSDIHKIFQHQFHHLPNQAPFPLQSLQQRKQRETTSPQKPEGKPPIGAQLAQIPKTRLSTLARLSISQNESQMIAQRISSKGQRQGKEKNDQDSSNVLYDEDFEANDDNIFN